VNEIWGCQTFKKDANHKCGQFDYDLNLLMSYDQCCYCYVKLLEISVVY